MTLTPREMTAQRPRVNFRAMSKKKVEAESRTVRRTVDIQQWRCVVCGTWMDAQQPRLTCSDSHRVLLHRMRQKGEKPPYAK